MPTSKAIWNRDTQRSFFRALAAKCAAIKGAEEYRAASKWLDRLYQAIAIPPTIFAQADNRLLLALMRAEDRNA